MTAVYPVDVDLAAWCARYGIEVFSEPCPSCGRTLTANIPYAGPNGERGLTSEVCRCTEAEDGRTSHICTFVRDDLQQLGGF